MMRNILLSVRQKRGEKFVCNTTYSVMFKLVEEYKVTDSVKCFFEIQQGYARKLIIINSIVS